MHRRRLPLVLLACGGLGGKRARAVIEWEDHKGFFFPALKEKMGEQTDRGSFHFHCERYRADYRADAARRRQAFVAFRVDDEA
jgi:hypothetical protein